MDRTPLVPRGLGVRLSSAAFAVGVGAFFALWRHLNSYLVSRNTIKLAHFMHFHFCNAAQLALGTAENEQK